MHKATRPTYTLAKNMRTKASTALVKSGRISMKKLLTVLLRLMIPLSIRDCSRPVSFPSVLKNDILNDSTRSTTLSERS